VTFRKNPDVGPKNVSHKECSRARIFERACLSMFRSLESGPTLYSGAWSGSRNYRSGVCALSRCADWTADQICFYEKTFPFATCCKFEKNPWNEVLSIFHIHHGGLDFLSSKLEAHQFAAKPIQSNDQRLVMFRCYKMVPKNYSIIRPKNMMQLERMCDTWSIPPRTEEP
jgi:hypothetical protein